MDYALEVFEEVHAARETLPAKQQALWRDITYIPMPDTQVRSFHVTLFGAARADELLAPETP